MDACVLFGEESEDISRRNGWDMASGGCVMF